MNDRKKRSDRIREWEIRFYEGILRRAPDYVEVLKILAELYTRQQRYEEGLELDRRLARLRPEDPLVFYNLACSLSLTGDVSGAFRALERAFELGYADAAWMARDPDLRAVRRDPRYGAFLVRHGLAEEEES